MLAWSPQARLYAAYVYEHAHRITSVSHANVALQRMLAPPGKPIEVIPNGVPFEAPRRPTSTDRRANVVFAGRVAPEKGVDRFIEIASLLSQHHPDVRFEVRGPIGDEYYGERCLALARSLRLGSNMTFSGASSRRTLLADVDLLVAPSRTEACPYTVLEALASGIPVVATQVGDCARMLAGGGLAVRSETSALAKAVERLLDPEIAQAASIAGRKQVAAYYTLQTMLGRYRNIYDELERSRWRSAA